MPMSNRAMDPIEAEFDALMEAVDADLEGSNPESALARLEEFIQKHARDAATSGGSRTRSSNQESIRRP